MMKYVLALLVCVSMTGCEPTRELVADLTEDQLYDYAILTSQRSANGFQINQKVTMLRVEDDPSPRIFYTRDCTQSGFGCFSFGENNFPVFVRPKGLVANLSAGEEAAELILRGNNTALITNRERRTVWVWHYGDNETAAMARLAELRNRSRAINSGVTQEGQRRANEAHQTLDTAAKVGAAISGTPVTQTNTPSGNQSSSSNYDLHPCVAALSERCREWQRAGGTLRAPRSSGVIQ